MRAKTEPIVEVIPFTPKAQGIRLRSFWSKRLIPEGKGIPINKLKGAKNKIDRKDFKIKEPWILKKEKEIAKKTVPIKIKTRIIFEIFTFSLLVKKLPIPLNNSIENRAILIE
jgi:hypothetical protein